MDELKEKPLIVQSDGSLLMDVHNPAAEEARSRIAVFSELEKSPEHIHTYRITPLSLWNAASAGYTPQQVIDQLRSCSRYTLPQTVEVTILDQMERFGKLILSPHTEKTLFLHTQDPAIRAEIQSTKRLERYLSPEGDGFIVNLVDRGTVKQELIRLGYPVKDEAPLAEGDPLPITLRERTLQGDPFVVRDYQAEAARALTGDREPGTGFGVIVLPCGSGKTIVGIKVL